MANGSFVSSPSIAAWLSSNAASSPGVYDPTTTPAELGLKEFIVCLAKELPSFKDRTPDKMYFLFDKLELYIGQTRYNDPFAIVGTIPTNPVFNMLYICLDDGLVKIYLDYSVKAIAKVSSQEALDLLTAAGTTFFTNADKRYLDEDRKVVHLPYNNGTYELTVDLAKNLKIDENTIIAFNPETNMFEFTNHYQDYDLVFGQGYHPIETNTIKMDVSEHRISANIKISEALDNIIKATDDGIYAIAKDAVTAAEFNAWKSSFQDYKAKMEYYLNALIDKVEKESDIGISNLNDKITAALVDVIPEAQDGFDRFDELAANIENLETECKAYTDTKFNDAYNDLSGLIQGSGDASGSNANWEEI